MTASDRMQRNMAAALAMATGGAAGEISKPIPVASIQPSPVQPRVYFDEADMARLAADIQERGILQPVLVRPVGAGYELVDGERRWRAAQRLGLGKIPAFVRTMTLEQARLAALSTAYNKAALTPIEHATAKLGLAALALGMEDLESVKLELGRLSRPAADPEQRQKVEAVFATLDDENLRSFAKSSLPLLNYPAELQEAMRDGLDKSKARVIKSAPEELRPKLLQMARGGASKRELADVVKGDEGEVSAPSLAQQVGKFLLSTGVDKLPPSLAEALATWLASAPEFARKAIGDNES